MLFRSLSVFPVTITNHETTIIHLHLPYTLRTNTTILQKIQIHTQTKQLIALNKLTTFQTQPEKQTIYHKNLHPIIYVTTKQINISPINTMFTAQKNLAVPNNYEIVWNNKKK